MPQHHDFLPILRELVRAYQAFHRYSAAHVRELGLTPAQFDIIATLGNTPGMNFRELGQRTLITKGTLTGVVDRMAQRGLVCRMPSSTDRRQAVVCLTAAGEECFNVAFPAHLAELARAFDALAVDRMGLEQGLRALRDVFEGTSPPSAEGNQHE